MEGEMEMLQVYLLTAVSEVSFSYLPWEKILEFSQFIKKKMAPYYSSQIAIREKFRSWNNLAQMQETNEHFHLFSFVI